MDYSQEAVRMIQDLVNENSGDEGLNSFLKELQTYVSPETLPHQRGWRNMFGPFMHRIHSRKMRKEVFPVIGILQQWEESLGYRENILTHQEHLLMGSSCQGFGTIDAYTPLCFFKTSNLTLEEIRKARKLKRYSNGVTSHYLIPEHKKNVIPILLEEVGTDKKTIRDPTPLNNNYVPIIDYTKSDDFPFRRD